MRPESNTSCPLVRVVICSAVINLGLEEWGGTKTKNQEKERRRQLHKCKARRNLKTCDRSTQNYNMAEPQTHRLSLIT